MEYLGCRISKLNKQIFDLRIIKIEAFHFVYSTIISSILFILSLYVFNFWRLRDLPPFIYRFFNPPFLGSRGRPSLFQLQRKVLFFRRQIYEAAVGRQFKTKACIEVTCTPAGWVRVVRLRFHFYDAHPVPGSHPLEHALLNSAGSDHVLTVNARAKGISVSIICTIRSVTRRRASDRRAISSGGVAWPCLFAVEIPVVVPLSAIPLFQIQHR